MGGPVQQQNPVTEHPSSHPAIVLPVRILGTGSELPAEQHTTEELCRRAALSDEAAERQRRSGIRTRYWLGPGQSAASLAAAALRAALQSAGCEAVSLRRLIFVSSTGGDRLVPATANDILAALDLSDSCDAFDLNNGCVGFLSALDLAARSVATGCGPVAVVASETFSPYLFPEHPRPYLLFGDAAAAVIVGPAREGEGFLGLHLRNTASLRGRVHGNHPGRTGRFETIVLDASARELTESAHAALRSSIDAVLARAKLALSEVDWVLLHQPNAVMFRKLADALGVEAHKLLPIAEQLGSVGAASVPFSLDRLLAAQQVRPGARILLASVGAGTACGAALYQVAP